MTTTSPEQHIATAIDHLSYMQIVALEMGTKQLALDFIDAQFDDPHPIKHNVGGRVTTAGLYQTVLHRELFYNLPKRDPRKARHVADELALSRDSSMREEASQLAEQLDKVAREQQVDGAEG